MPRQSDGHSSGRALAEGGEGDVAEPLCTNIAEGVNMSCPQDIVFRYQNGCFFAEEAGRSWAEVAQQSLFLATAGVVRHLNGCLSQREWIMAWQKVQSSRLTWEILKRMILSLR